jgi:hypothetical protein
MRKCRFCHEDIEDAATVCAHCSRDLIPGRHTAPAAVVTPTTSAPPPTVKTCPFCAEEIQDAAIVCKHCGRDLMAGRATPPPYIKTSHATGTHLLVILGALAVVALSLWMMGVGESANSPPAPLDASVRFSGTQFVITNDSAEALTSIVCLLNGDYEYKLDAIKAHDSASIGAMAFAKTDGTRFNPFATKPRNMVIEAEIDAHGTKAHARYGW